MHGILLMWWLCTSEVNKTLGLVNLGGLCVRTFLCLVSSFEGCGNNILPCDCGTSGNSVFTKI